MSDERSYLVAFAGSRDGYQAALALEEVGRLSQLVTDAYLPDLLARVLPLLPEGIADRLGRRRAAGLPSRRVHSLPHVVASRVLLDPLLGQYRALRLTDDMLGRRAGREASRSGSASLVYSYYWPGFLHGAAPSTSPAVVLQVHPVPSHIKRVLAEDRARTGIVGWLDEEEVLRSSTVAAFESSLRAAAAIIVPSSFVRDGLLHIDIPEEHIAVVPYGCSFPPAPEEAPATHAEAGPLRLLWVGQASYRKGPHHLLTALRSLPTGTATLTMVCRGGELGLLGQLPPGVEVLRAVSRDRLHELYASHDVFVMPSLAEGFGLVYLEAMSRGLPVIATSNTGVADISPGSPGLVLVPPGDPHALAEALNMLAAGRDELPARRRAARETAATMTWPRFRSDLRRALDRLVPSDDGQAGLPVRRRQDQQ